jgi:hypothetical protein
MPLYVYCCRKCEAKIDRAVSQEEFEELALFETSHAMEASERELKEARKCPRCGSIDCYKSYEHHNVTAYIRGNGYLDKKGTTRDRNVYTLDNNDPYAQYRVPGETDHIKTQLKKAGQHDPKTQHYVVRPASKDKPKK